MTLVEEPPLEFHELFDLVGGDGLSEMLPQVEGCTPATNNGSGGYGLNPNGPTPDMMMVAPQTTTVEFMDEKYVTEYDAIINHPKRQGKPGQQRWMSDEFRGERRKITSEDVYELVQRFETPQITPDTQQYVVGRILYMCKQSNGDVLYRKASEDEIKKNVNSNRNKKGSGSAGGKAGKSTSGNKRQKPSEPSADETMSSPTERTLRDDIEFYSNALRELEGPKCLIKDYRAQSLVFRKTLDAFMALPFADDTPGLADTTIEFHGYYQIRRTMEVMWNDLCKGYGYNSNGLFMGGTPGGGAPPSPPYSGGGGGGGLNNGFGGSDAKYGGGGSSGGHGGHSSFGGQPPSHGGGYGGYQGGGYKECATRDGEDEEGDEETDSSEDETVSEAEEESEYQGGGKSLSNSREQGAGTEPGAVTSLNTAVSFGKQFDHVDKAVESSVTDTPCDDTKQQEASSSPEAVDSSTSQPKQDDKNVSFGESKQQKEPESSRPYQEFDELVEQIEEQIKASSSDDDLGESSRMFAEVVLNFMDGNIDDEEAQIYGLKLVWERCKGSKLIESFIAVNVARAIVRAMDSFKDSKKLQKNACGALWSLCIDAATTTKLVQAGACEQVVTALRRFMTDKSVARYAVGALRTLSTDKGAWKSCQKLNASDAVMQAMEQQKSNLDIQKHGCAFLSNYAVDKESGATMTVPSKEIQAVVHAMMTHHKDISVMSAGCLALKNYTSDSENLSALCHCDGIKDLCFRLGENQKFSSSSYRADATTVLGRIASSRVEEPVTNTTEMISKALNEDKKSSAYPDSKKQSRGNLDAEAKSKARARSAASSAKASEKTLASRAAIDSSAEVVTRKKGAFTGRLGHLTTSAAQQQQEGH